MFLLTFRHPFGALGFLESCLSLYVGGEEQQQRICNNMRQKGLRYKFIIGGFFAVDRCFAHQGLFILTPLSPMPIIAHLFDGLRHDFAINLL